MTDQPAPTKTPGGVGAVECTYPSCTLAFRSVREMKNHKRNDPEHDYCNKCDVDCDSWDDFVEHKANANPKVHIACLHCGQDFKSIPGRNRHIAQTHPVDQQLPCSGCKKVFARASSMIAHIEKGLCKKIDQDDFQGHIQHKKIIRSILEQPERTIGKAPPARTAPAELPSPIPAEACQYPKLASNQNGGYGNPDSGSSDIGSAANLETIQTRTQEDASDNIQRLGSNLANVSLTTSSEEANGTQHANKPTNESTRNPHQTESTKNGSLDTIAKSNLSSANKTANFNGGNSSNPPSSWKANASTSLFPKAKVTPLTQDWEATLERDHARAAQPRNMFRVRFWDPLSDDYDPEQFFDAATERYKCPIPDCRSDFTAPVDLEQHILATHRTFTPKCPHCHRVFKSTAALVAHCETPYSSRCSIARSDKFGHIVDSISGGLLAASEEARPDQPDVRFVEYRAAPKPVGLRGRGWAVGSAGFRSGGRNGDAGGYVRREGRGRGGGRDGGGGGGASRAKHGRRNGSGGGEAGGVVGQGNGYWNEGGLEERGYTVIGGGGEKGGW